MESQPICDEVVLTVRFVLCLAWAVFAGVGYATACEADEFIMHNWQVVELASGAHLRFIDLHGRDGFTPSIVWHLRVDGVKPSLPKCKSMNRRCALASVSRRSTLALAGLACYA